MKYDTVDIVLIGGLVTGLAVIGAFVLWTVYLLGQAGVAL